MEGARPVDSAVAFGRRDGLVGEAVTEGTLGGGEVGRVRG